MIKIKKSYAASNLFATKVDDSLLMCWIYYANDAFLLSVTFTYFARVLRHI